MYFVNRYRADAQPYGFTATDSELPGIVEAAEKPSLDDIAWAMVYPRPVAHSFALPQSRKGQTH